MKPNKFELNGQIQKKTGAKWAEILNLKFDDFSAFGGERNFLVNLYEKSVFLELASLCKVRPAEILTRRDAFKLKNKINQGL